MAFIDLGHIDTYTTFWPRWKNMKSWWSLLMIVKLMRLFPQICKEFYCGLFCRGYDIDPWTNIVLHFPSSSWLHYCGNAFANPLMMKSSKSVRGIDRPPVNSPHKVQWRGALMFSLICAWINGWVNNGGAGDLRRQGGHYGVSVMCPSNYPHS